MARTIDKAENVIDSREVQARIDDLESDIAAYEEDAEAGEEVDADDLNELKEELDILEAFADEAADCTSEWDDGATFINADYFETYAREFAADIGAIEPKRSWPLNCIDWADAAEELRQDYSTVEFDGQDFYVQST